MRAAIRDPNPVLFFEHKYLYRRIKGDAARRGSRRCRSARRAWCARDGTSTVVTWAAMVHVALEAAEKLAARGDRARGRRPAHDQADGRGDGARLGAQDRAARSSSPRSRYTGSVAGDVAARIAEKAFWHLDAPLARVTCLDTPVPYSPPLEDYYLPNAREARSPGSRAACAPDGARAPRRRRLQVGSRGAFSAAWKNSREGAVWSDRSQVGAEAGGCLPGPSWRLVRAGIG